MCGWWCQGTQGGVRPAGAPLALRLRALLPRPCRPHTPCCQNPVHPPLSFQLPYYSALVNYAWVGLWAGITFTASLLVALDFTLEHYEGDAATEYRAMMTMVRDRHTSKCCMGTPGAGGAVGCGPD